MTKDPSSFRDPSGFVFRENGVVYRAVRKSYEDDFRFFLKSGLQHKLFESHLLVRFEAQESSEENIIFRLRPDPIPLITYPYEWSFAQLKDAATLTLDVLTMALDHGMTLKDASAFNIQFVGAHPVFMDSLSFTRYVDDRPWQAYRQFCENFIAPLYIASRLGSNALASLKPGVDGLDLVLASSILPFVSWLDLNCLLHVHLHARSITKYGGNGQLKKKERSVPKRNMMALVEHLRTTVKSIHLKKNDLTEWRDYDLETHYSEVTKHEKEKVLLRFVERVNAKVIWDIGSNEGHYSRLIAKQANRLVLSLDFDPNTVQKNYFRCREQGIDNVYPLIFDIANPTPSIGWANKERPQLSQRSRPDLVVALALIHHLVITKNIPFELVASYLSELSEYLIIEFVPYRDSKIEFLPDTAGKRDYSRENFLGAFLQYYELIEEISLVQSSRSIFLLRCIR